MLLVRSIGKPFRELSNAYYTPQVAPFHALFSMAAASTEIAAASRVLRIVENLILILRSWCWNFLRVEYVEEHSLKNEVFQAFEYFNKLFSNILLNADSLELL
jgi:hypothetical protein